MHPSEVPTVTVDAIPADAVLLDCREDEEWQAGHIDGAVHVPMNEIPQRSELSAGTDSRPTARSWSCARWAAARRRSRPGSTRTATTRLNLDGGMLAWASAGRPMVSENGQRPVV